jgi:hypothetical protein
LSDCSSIEASRSWRYELRAGTPWLRASTVVAIASFSVDAAGKVAPAFEAADVDACGAAEAAPQRVELASEGSVLPGHHDART